MTRSRAGMTCPRAFAGSALKYEGIIGLGGVPVIGGFLPVAGGLEV